MSSSDATQNTRHRVFGVDYTRMPSPDGGDLYLTRFGEPLRDVLLPERWYDGRQYSQGGKRLEGGTGAVYHLSVPHDRLGEVRLVIKFSRFARDVPLSVSSEFLAWVPQQDIDGARFNTPFEEFAEVMRLRDLSAAAGQRLLTKRPLAIFVPGEHVPLWRSGRSEAHFDLCRRSHDQDQQQHPPERRVTLDIRRRYLLLFGWVKGLDALQMYERGVVDEEAIKRLTFRSIDDLKANGYRMLDVKPRHLILRQRPDGSLLTRHGRTVYALIDFELLQRTGA